MAPGLSLAELSLCLLLGRGTLCAQPARASIEPRDASVAGIVLDAGTGAPLPKALVTLSTAEDQPMDAQALTDRDGRFTFSNVPPGRYQLHADSSGYQPWWYGAATAHHVPGILRLETGEKRADLVIRLEALGAIFGAVSDQDGDPVEGVVISLWAQSFWRGKPKYFQRAEAGTNDRGHYRIGHLAPGRYIAMSNGGWRPALRIQPEAVAGSPAGELSRFGLQFFAGADRMSAATVVNVAPGKEIEGVDFHLSPKPAATLHGTVIPPEDLPSGAQILVAILRRDMPDEDESITSFHVSPPHFSFEQYSLVPGEYLLVANFSFGGRQYRGVRHVSLSAGWNEASIPLEPGIDLRGSLRIAGGGDPREYHIELVAGDALPFPGHPPRSAVNADGSFVLRGVVPSVWDIGVQPVPPEGYIQSMKLGDQDVLTEDMIIGPRTSAPLRIVVSTRGGVLEGRVTKDSGADAGRAIVLLAPHGRFSHVLSFYTTAVTGEAGRFKLQGLTPGSYRVYAFEAMEDGAWQDPQFLQPFESLGESVEITEGVNASKQVRLIPAARIGQ